MTYRTVTFQNTVRYIGGRWQEMPVLPDHLDVIDNATAENAYDALAKYGRDLVEDRLARELRCDDESDEPHHRFAVFGADDRYQELQGGELAHGCTYSGHPVCAAVALENARLGGAWSAAIGGASGVHHRAPFLDRVADRLLHVYVRAGLHRVGGIERIGAGREVYRKARRRFAVEAGAATVAFLADLDTKQILDSNAAMDRLLGRDHFINEIIWSYDYGARSTKRCSSGA